MAQDKKAAMLAQQQALNAHYMRYTFEQPIQAAAQNGTAYGAQPLNFDFPIVAGAFATRIRVYHTINFTYTAAGAAPYATVNAAAPYSVWREIGVSFGNPQIKAHPYLSKVLTEMKGYNRTPNGTTIGNQSSSVQSMLSTPIAVNPGANTWKFYFDIPLNAIHPLSPYGLLPMGSSGTRGQLQLIPAVNFQGVDPLDNVVNTNGTITNVTGSVKVVIFYRDHKSFATPAALQPSLEGLPTSQVIRVPDINPLTAGTPVYKRITNPYPFVKLINLVIDGNQSTKFADAANITAFRIDSSDNTNAGLRIYDASTGGMENYYSRVREVFGQDLDDGVLIYDALTENTTAPDLMEGEAFLNLTDNGFPAARLGFNVNSVGNVAGITPRIVTFGVILNPMGIQ